MRRLTEAEGQRLLFPPAETEPNLAPGRCKSCGATIWWVRMKGSASAMPVDNDSHRVIVLESTGGEYLVGVVREGYTPHWYTCPSAETHRRTRKGGRANG